MSSLFHRPTAAKGVYQHRSRKAAGKSLDYIGFRPANPPPHHLDVLVNLLSRDLQLLLTVTCYFDPQVLDGLDTLDAVDFLNVFLCEDFRLPFIEAEVPLLL